MPIRKTAARAMETRVRAFLWAPMKTSAREKGLVSDARLGGREFRRIRAPTA